MDETRKLLVEEIKSQNEDISGMATGSEEKSNAIEDLSSLYKLKLEEDKLTTDFGEKKLSEDLRLKEQSKDRKVKVCIATAELIVPLIFYGIWMRQGFKFEKDGIIASTTFRGLINRFRPTKK